MVQLLTMTGLGQTEASYDFQGIQHDSTVSFIAIDVPPGQGPALHSHPYEEIFVVLDGSATYKAGDQEIEVSAGQVVVVQAGVPHKFVSSGSGRLRQVDIHANKQFVTTWLEE